MFHYGEGIICFFNPGFGLPSAELNAKRGWSQKFRGTARGAKGRFFWLLVAFNHSLWLHWIDWIPLGIKGVLIFIKRGFPAMWGIQHMPKMYGILTSDYINRMSIPGWMLEAEPAMGKSAKLAVAGHLWCPGLWNTLPCGFHIVRRQKDLGWIFLTIPKKQKNSSSALFLW